MKEQKNYVANERTRSGFHGGSTHPFIKTQFVCLSEICVLVKLSIRAAREALWPHYTWDQESCEARREVLGCGGSPHTQNGRGEADKTPRLMLGPLANVQGPHGKTLPCRTRTLGYVPGKEPSSILEEEMNLKTRGQEQKLLQNGVFSIQEVISAVTKGGGGE